MAVKTVLATIIDIRKDSPRKEDSFFVDTNGWRNLTYTRIRRPQPEYVEYLKHAHQTGATLLSSAITYLELASTIENDEWEVFKSEGNIVDKKMFRHQHADQRRRVLAEISTSWKQVTQLSQVVGATIDMDATERFERYIRESPLDGYDLPLLDLMERRGVFNVVTNDCDFAAVPGLTVFTANTAVLATARRQGRLKVR